MTGTRHAAGVNPPPSVSSVSDLADAIRGFWRALVRRKREFFAVAITVAVVVQLASFLWPATYVAHAAILIQQNRSTAGLDAAGDRTPTVVSSGVSEHDVNSEVAVLTSRQVIEATIEATGIDKAQPSIWLRILFGPLWLYEDAYAWFHGVRAPTLADRAIRSFESSLEVEPMKDSNVLVVSYESGNPTFAEIVLKTLLEKYLEHHVEVHRSSGAEAFFEEQARSLAAELETQEQQLQALKASVGVTDIAMERTVQQQIVASLREEQARLERTIAELDSRGASHKSFLEREPRQMQTTTVEGRNDAALQALIQQKLDLELERVRLVERYRADSPLLAENQRKLDAAAAAIANQRSSVSQRQSSLSATSIAASEGLEQTRAERAGFEMRIAKLEEQLARENERLKLLDDRLLESKRLERLISTTETQYLQYLRRGVEARINTALDQGQFTNASIVQQAAAAPRPVRPKRLITVLLSLAGGLVAGLATVVGLELKESGLEAFLGSVAPRPAVDPS
jgi:uncharacterized protein involved in exopolysaccharide biosynthesis